MRQTMNIKRFTRIAGVVFIGVGISGFIPGLSVGPHIHDPALTVNSGSGRLFGLFPVNVLHNFVHIALGVWALMSAPQVSTAIRFNRVSATIYGLLAVIGLFPGLNTLFGALPLFSHDIWFHASIALATGYYGFVLSKRDIRLRSTATVSDLTGRFNGTGHRI